MKLAEIFNTGTIAHDLIDTSKLDIANATALAQIEGGKGKLYKLPQNPNYPNTIVYGLIYDGVLVSAVGGEYHTVNDTEYFIIKSAQTLPEYRKKGLISAIYATLADELRIKLLSDKQMSPEMFNLWEGLNDRYSIKVVDVNTGNISNMKDISDDDLFNKDDPTQYRLIFENTSMIPSVRSGILIPPAFFTKPGEQYE